MKSKKLKNKTFLYIPLAFAFLVLAIFTNSAYSSLQESLITRENYIKKIWEKLEQRNR